MPAIARASASVMRRSEGSPSTGAILYAQRHIGKRGRKHPASRARHLRFEGARMAVHEPIVVGIDAGGTMTDTILVDERGHFKIGKAATTPHNEAEGFIASAGDAADGWGILRADPGAAAGGIALEALFAGAGGVLYSGTAMLNTLLSRTGSKLGLITPKGLEDMVLMGRGLQAWADYSYADRLHAVTHHHPEPLVPRKRTHGVTERVD